MRFLIEHLFTITSKRLLILLIILAVSPTYANEIFTSSLAEEYIKVIDHADWLVDNSKKITAKEIIEGYQQTINFQSSGSFEIPSPPVPIWFKFTLKNDTNRTINLRLFAEKSYQLDQMIVYQLSNPIKTQAMIKNPHSRRKFSSSLTLGANQTQEYLIYLPAIAQQYLVISSLRIMSESGFNSKLFYDLAISYSTLGIISALTLYNLVLFLYTREKAYLYYTFHAAAAGTFFSMYDEIGYQVLELFITSEDYLAKFLWWSSAPGLAGLLLFSKEFLEVKKHQPTLNHFFSALTIIVVILSLSGMLFDRDTLRDIIITLCLIIYLSLLVLSIIAWRKKLPQAGIYIIAFLFYLATSIIAAGSWVMESNLDKATHYIELTRLGIITNLILLSIALANIIQRLKQEQTIVEAKAKSAIESSELKSQFLANMSHEIRTPINGIIGMGEIIKENSDNIQNKHNAEVLLNAADSLLSVVNDILDFSKLEAGKIKIQSEIFSTGQLLANLGTLYFGLNKNQNIEFSVNISDEVAPFLVGDQLRIEQILNNLLSNAFKFTAQGHIELCCQPIKTYDDKQLIEFSVIDSGIGISSDSAKKLFTAYEQADKTSTRQYGGTGLGLAISKELAEMMDGEIVLKSEEGKGSTFSLLMTMPIDKQREKELLEQRKVLKNKTIAIIFSNEAHGENELTHTLNIGMNPTLHVVNSGTSAYNPIPNIEENDLIYTSDMIGESLAVILSESEKHDIPVIVARTNHGNFKQDWVGNANAYFIFTPASPIEIESVFCEAITGNSTINDNLPVKKLITKASLPTLNILVAEDNQTNQIVIKTLLEKLHQNVFLVSNGKEAHDLYRKEEANFDLILMDCEMPIIDGYETTKKIRQHEKDNQWPNTYICALTAHVMDENYKKCLKAGMNKVLTKPVKLEQIEQLILSLEIASR